MKTLRFNEKLYKIIGEISTEKINEEKVGFFKNSYQADLVLKSPNGIYLFLEEIFDAHFEEIIENAGS